MNARITVPSMHKKNKKTDGVRDILSEKNIYMLPLHNCSNVQTGGLLCAKMMTMDF